MITTSPSIADPTNAGPSSKRENLHSPTGSLAMLRQARHRYPLYFTFSGLIAASALAALTLLVSAIFLSDYMSAAHNNVAKIIQVRHAITVQPSQMPPGEVAVPEFQRSQIASLLNDPGIRSSPEEALTLLQTALETQDQDAASDVFLVLTRAEHAIEQDTGHKRFIVTVVQAGSFALLLLLLARTIILARTILADRIGDTAQAATAGRSAVGVGPSLGDEIDRLDRAVHALIDLRHGPAIETPDSSSILARMARTHDFLCKSIASAMRPPFRASMLRKILFSLERTLDLENAAIVFSEDASRIHSDRCLFSNQEPAVLPQPFRAELHRAGPGAVLETPDELTGTKGAAVGFEDASGELSILQVEFQPDRTLKPFELQTLRITAGLLSVAAKLDGHDHEARRVAVLEERAAIARELHDSLAQSLSYMKIQLARLQSYQGNSEFENKQQIQTVTSELRQGLDNAYKELRELLVTFRVHMDARGLDCAIESAIEEFTQRSGVPVSLDNRLAGVPLTVNEEFHVLQVVREALSNILHHAAAHNVTIVMAQQGSGPIAITIDDDGVGPKLPASAQSAHHGQTIMKERALNLGGSIEIVPKTDCGTRVRLTFTPKKAQ